MNIGLLCYASIGGSGIVATELGKALADRGHEVHFISADLPFRLTEFHPGLSFHQVLTPSYPLFREPQYMLSLANRLVQVAREYQLAIVHAHYAVPHATAALLARQVLASSSSGPVPEGDHDPARHGHHAGRERSLVLGDRRLLDRAIRRRDGSVGQPGGGHAAPARSAAPDLGDPELHRLRAVPPPPMPCLRTRFTEHGDGPLVIHVSNFRPVKRIDAVMQVFARIASQVNARLLLVGDGPEVSTAHRLGAGAGGGRSDAVAGGPGAGHSTPVGG